jgi:outer membrane protein TolC
MRISQSGWLSLVLGALAFATMHASAQISLTTAVDLALRNDPKVKMAQADRDKAVAALAEAHDVFVPSLVTEGGVGKSSGVPLALPVVFSITARSLAFNFSQEDYIRAAHDGVAAADFALRDARDNTAEDAVTTYVSLDNALQRKAALVEASGFAARVTQIVQDRFDAGLEPHIELTRAMRTSAQLRLQQLRVEDEIAALSAHLARVTGLAGAHPETVHDSIPEFNVPAVSDTVTADTYGIRAAMANATAKQEIARGDSRYRYRPQLAFSAGYSRISTAFTNYAQYYPGFNTDLVRNQANSFNAIDIGIQISIPLLDLVHQARARGAAADAAHARFEVESQRNQLFEGRLKLEHAAAELEAKTEIASLDRGLAQDQLDALEIQLQSAATTPNGPQMTPKDEQNARLQERQRYLDLLDADLELRQTQINLMKDNGQLGDWLHGAITTPGGVPPPRGPGTVLPSAPTPQP